MISTGTGVANSKRPSMGALAPNLNIKDTALIAQDRIDAIGQGLAACGGVEQLRQVDGTGALRFLKNQGDKSLPVSSTVDNVNFTVDN
jgi:hypothetical protein